MKRANRSVFLARSILAFLAVALLWAGIGSAYHTRSRQKPVAPRPAKALPAKWSPADRYRITESDLAYGRQQVARMVRDRPEMSQGVNERAPIWQWCARQFAGASVGRRVSWSNEKPGAMHFGADHLPPQDGQPGYIRIESIGQRLTGGVSPCEDLWSKAAYELNNAANDPEFIRITTEAVDGTLAREEFLEQYMRLDYVASVETRQVYAHLWKGVSAANCSRSARWCISVPGSFTEWVKDPQGHSKLPHDYAASYYDNDVMPCLKMTGKYNMPRANAARFERWPIPETFPAAESDLRYGEAQVERMVKDRPAMARCAGRNSPIWKWCARHFAGVSANAHIGWDSVRPVGCGAEYIGSRSGRHRLLRVSDLHHSENSETRPATGEEMWARAVFELNNASNDAGFLRADDAARRGKLTRDQYIRSYAQLEYLACWKTALVYEHDWTERGTQELPVYAYWFFGIPDKFEDWFAHYSDRTQYPWNPYGRYFDRLSGKRSGRG